MKNLLLGFLLAYSATVTGVLYYVYVEEVSVKPVEVNLFQMQVPHGFNSNSSEQSLPDFSA